MLAEESIHSRSTDAIYKTHSDQSQVANLSIPRQPLLSTLQSPLRHSSPLRTHSHRPTSFLLALGYTEQLSAATHSMFNLGGLAADWGANMVEPFVRKSFLFGLQNVLPPEFTLTDKNTIELFQIYDKEKVNKVFHEKISRQVTMFDFRRFIADAPEDVTVFHFGTRSSEKTQRIFALNAQDTRTLEQNMSNSNDSVLQCHSMELSGLQQLAGDIEREMNSERSKQTLKNDIRFKVNRMLCLDPQKVYRSDKLGQYLPSTTTIIFTNWRGCGLRKCTYSDQESDMSPPLWKDSFRYAIRTKTHANPRLGDEHILHHASVEVYAKRYLKHLGYTEPFVSIHIRTERLLKLSIEKNDPNFVQRCLKELLVIANNLTHSGKKIKTLLLTDVGSKYGTSTCRRGKQCNKSRTGLIMNQLQVLGLHHEWYNPSVLNSTENSGYVSLVEMRMLALGEKLLLVGFGGFQAIAKNLFLSYGHSNNDVIHICHS